MKAPAEGYENTHTHTRTHTHTHTRTHTHHHRLAVPVMCDAIYGMLSIKPMVLVSHEKKLIRFKCKRLLSEWPDISLQDQRDVGEGGGGGVSQP